MQSVARLTEHPRRRRPPKRASGGAGSPEPPLKDLLRVSDLTPESLRLLLQAANRFKYEPFFHHGQLAGQTVVLYFNKPSTRTRISFETAVARLGGTPLAVGPQDLQLGRGETIEDTARVIAAYARAFVVRTYSDEEVRRFAAASRVPVVNALTDLHHPCQALADLMTLTELWGDPQGRRVAFVGDGDNVAHSLLEGCALLGVHIAVATPPGREPQPQIVRTARRLARAGGSDVSLTHDPQAAVRGADAVYTDVWVSMGVPEAEREQRLREFAPYRVTAALMAEAAPEAVFLHCLPAHRGEEVAAEVIDGPQSVVFQQAANRLPTEQAVLWALLSAALRAAPAEEGGER